MSNARRARQRSRRARVPANQARSAVTHTRRPEPDTIRWEKANTPNMLLMQSPSLQLWHGYVRDGYVKVLVGREPSGWHLSISHTRNDRGDRPARYPSWDEIADARYKFTPADVTMAMLLPPEEEYVNLHETTLHLYEVPGDPAEDR